MLNECLFLLQQELTSGPFVATCEIWVLNPSLPPYEERDDNEPLILLLAPWNAHSRVWPGVVCSQEIKPIKLIQVTHWTMCANCWIASHRQCLAVPRLYTLPIHIPRSVWHQTDHFHLTCDFPPEGHSADRELKRRWEVKQMHTWLQSTPSVHSKLTLLDELQSVHNQNL